MSTASDTQSEQHGHQHRDVSGGWLRPAVFGAMDGLVTNVSLIAGVGGGGGSHQFIVLTGLAGLAAGAFSMATGEFVSVSSQNELIGAEVRKEAHELKHNPESEQEELAETFRARGVDPELAAEVARQLSVQPDNALARPRPRGAGRRPRGAALPLHRGGRVPGHLRRGRPDPPDSLPGRPRLTPAGTRASPRSPPSSAVAW